MMAAKRNQKELSSFTALKAMADALPPMTIEEYRKHGISLAIGIASDEVLLAPEDQREERRRFIRDSFPQVDNPMLIQEYEAYLCTLNAIDKQAEER